MESHQDENIFILSFNNLQIIYLLKYSKVNYLLDILKWGMVNEKICEAYIQREEKN